MYTVYVCIRLRVLYAIFRIKPTPQLAHAKDNVKPKQSCNHLPCCLYSLLRVYKYITRYIYTSCILYNQRPQPATNMVFVCVSQQDWTRLHSVALSGYAMTSFACINVSHFRFFSLFVVVVVAI